MTSKRTEKFTRRQRVDGIIRDRRKLERTDQVRLHDLAEDGDEKSAEDRPRDPG